tara:strand:+ start:28 stop:612 length:585 start_codon:yes stop_codon:yes gene_type:complete
MKATHEIKLKSIEDILKQEEPHKLLAVDYLVFINDNQGNYIEAKLRDDGCFLTEDTCIGHSHVSSFEEIKPKFEIPYGNNFWFIDNSDTMNRIHTIEYTDTQEYSHKWGNDRCNLYDEDYVIMMLNNGTWTICDEPEKVMIPWSDEDWKEWFLNDGVAIAIDDNHLFRPCLLDIFTDDSDLYTDRNGKPFTKEA